MKRSFVKVFVPGARGHAGWKCQYISFSRKRQGGKENRECPDAHFMAQKIYFTLDSKICVIAGRRTFHL